MSACGGWAALQRVELCRVTECHAAQRSATLLSSSPTECPCSTILQAAQPTSAPCIFPGLRMCWAGYQCTVPLMPRFVGANKTSAFSQCSPTDLVAARGQSRQHASRRGAHWQYRLLWHYLRSDEGRRIQTSNPSSRPWGRQRPTRTSCKNRRQPFCLNRRAGNGARKGCEANIDSVFGVPGGAPIRDGGSPGGRSSCSSSVQDTNRIAPLASAMDFVYHRLSVLPLLYADEELTGVLVETSQSSQKSDETVLGAIKRPAHIALALLIGKKCMFITFDITCHICFSQRIYSTSSLNSRAQHCTWRLWYAPALLLARQQASQDGVEQVLLQRFFQGFVLAEHEGYPRDFLGRTHGALPALALCITAIVQIWPCYARSSGGIQEHDCLPHFLALCGALL